MTEKNIILKNVVGDILYPEIANNSVNTNKIADRAVSIDKVNWATRTKEDGFYITDTNYNIGLVLTQELFDAVGLSNLIKAYSSNDSSIIQTVENGLYVTDKNLNIGFTLDSKEIQSGGTQIDNIQYTILEEF